MKKLLCFCTVLCVVLLMSASYAYADGLGYVKETDIVTFIDLCPIESFNYKGNTFVIAEALSKYGFDVAWDGDARTLDITRRERNFTPYVSDFINVQKENVTFKDIFKVYQTDIKTYINGNLAESYNIFGTTIVSVDAVGEYGGGIVKYDDEKRRLDVCIIEKEIENCEEKTESDENSALTEKGFFDSDGNLLYGIKTSTATSRYGTSEGYICGDFSRGKTVSVLDAYFNNNKKYTYSNVENYRVNVFPSDLENPSFTMNFDESATVHIEGDLRFKYGARVRSAEFKSGGEARYLAKTGEIYLINEKEILPYDDALAVYDDDGNEIYNRDTYPRSFNGMLFKDGRKIYDGEIKLDRFEFEVGSGINVDTAHITALYAPTYTDPDGVVYYYSDTYDYLGEYNERADCVLYRGNVVNGAMHGSGIMYYNDLNVGAGLKTGREITVYGKDNAKSVIYAVDENILYVGEFKDGRIDGRGKMYRNGALTSDGEWKNGKKDGFMIEYNSFADEIYFDFEGYYKDGVKQ